MKSHNPGEQLRRCVREFQEIKPFRSIIPTGAAFSEQGWTATASEVLEFLQTAEDLRLNAANFWSWDYCRNNLPNLWNTIASYPWAGQPVPGDIANQLINTLNTHDAQQVTSMYVENAVHINAERTVQGIGEIKTWYQNVFSRYPNSMFTLSGSSGSGNSRAFNWSANLTGGKSLNGNDTIGLQDGKISYHYTSLILS
jgi:hypothetical protein